MANARSALRLAAVRPAWPARAIECIDHSAATAGKQLHSGAMPARVLARWVAMFAAVFVLAACSSLRLGYNNADTLLMYAADSYLDLDSEQDAFARERVRALLAWHRRTQLREYARLLESVQQRLDTTATQPLTAAEVLMIQRQGADHMLTVGRQAAPDLVRLARMLKPEQIDYLGNKLAKDTEKLRRERRVAVSTSTGVASEARIKANLDRARTWLGRVTPEQEQLIREAALATPAAERRWIDNRERRQRALVALAEQVRQPSLSVDAAAALMLNAPDLAVDALVLANPWTIDGEEAPEALPASAIRSRYLAKLANPREVWRLVTGGVNLAKLAKGLRSAASSPPPPAGLVEEMTSGLSACSGFATILLASRDRTAQMFSEVWDAADPRIQRINSASHSFSDEAAREWLHARLIEVLRP